MRAPEKFFYTNDELAKELFAAARKLIVCIFRTVSR